MDFKQDYFEALLSERIGLCTNNSDHIAPTFVPVSQTALNTFYYVQGICSAEVSYPYSFEIKNLDSYYILYTASGEGQLYYQDTQYKLFSRSLVFIHCANHYYIQASKTSSWKFYGTYINGSNTAEYYHLFAENNTILNSVSELSQISKLIKKLHHHQQSSGNQRELINSKIITDLLTEILIDQARSNKKINKIPDYILNIKELFDEHYSNKYTLDLLSKKFGISKYKLVREFTNFISISPINYLINVRIAAAKDMLWSTSLTVNQISESVGIENTSHFINLFKKNTGLTPLLYRKQKPAHVIHYVYNE